MRGVGMGGCEVGLGWAGRRGMESISWEASYSLLLGAGVGCSFALPFALPFMVGAGGSGMDMPIGMGIGIGRTGDGEPGTGAERGMTPSGGGGGVVGNGLVSSRSAREYWFIMKNVWASQNASFGSSVGGVSGCLRESERGCTRKTQHFVSPKARRIV